MERSSGRTQDVSFLTKNIVGIDRDAIEFEWNIFPGFSSLKILQEIQPDLEKKNIKSAEFTDRLIFMSMFNDTDWTKRGNSEICISNAEKVRNHAKGFLQGHWTFLGPRSEKKWYEGSSYPPKGQWDSTANEMVQRFKETGQLVFKKHQCFESWNPEAEERFRNYSLQWRFVKYRTLVPNNSFCESAQCLRSSGELVRTIRLRRGREGTR